MEEVESLLRSNEVQQRQLLSNCMLSGANILGPVTRVKAQALLYPWILSQFDAQNLMKSLIMSRSALPTPDHNS